MEVGQGQTDASDTGDTAPSVCRRDSDGDTSSDGEHEGAGMEDIAENTDVAEESSDEFSDDTGGEEGDGIHTFVRDTTSLAQHIEGCCRLPQGETASGPQQQQQLQPSAGEVDQSQGPLSAATSLQVPETSALTPASTSTTNVPKTTSPEVPRTTALTPASTSSLLPRIPASVVSKSQPSGLPVVPANGDSSTVTQYNLIQVQQQFGDVTVKGGENLNIGGTQNVGTTPAKQEGEEKTLTAAQKIRKRTASRIESWTKDMVETKVFRKVKEKLDRGATWVTIKGRPGEGKSTTAYMALKDQYSQGREVYQVVSSEEFNEVIMACSNPVILLDDIFGDLEFDIGEWTKWRPSLRPIVDVKHPDKYTERVLERTNVHQTQQKQASSNNDKTIIILVGRDYVLKSSLTDLGRMADYISSPQYVVEVSSQRDSYERRKIWRVHAEAKYIDLEESVVSEICKTDCPHGFPHVCKMFAAAYAKDWTQLQMQTFFQAPLDFLRQTLDKCLQDVRKRSLFMAMIKRDGKITQQELEEDDTLGYECTEAADHLVGSYLKKEDDTYMFDHPSIYDSVSFILSTKLSKFVIENCSLSFLHQRLRLAPSKERETNVARETGIVANISWTYAGHLARRFASEIKMMNLRYVLSHQALCNSDFVDLLMDCLKTQCQMQITDVVKLTDKASKNTFCELLSTSKSHQLIKILMEKENISFNRKEERDILMGVYKYAASSVLKYVSGRMKLHINSKTKLTGETPLMLAATTKDSMFVSQILSLNPDLNARDDDGKSAFYYLCMNGLTSAVEHAIDKGVDINVHHWWSEHPIYRAIEEGHSEVVKLLVNRGCDVDNQKGLIRALQNRNENMVQFFINRRVNVDAFAVCTACEVGKLNVVKMLFEKGATVNMKAANGSTPLLSSCKGNPNVVTYLLKKGASVNETSYVTGDTALHIATGLGSTDVVDVLLKAGANVNVQNSTGDTPLLQASFQGSTECVNVLLKAGAAVNVENNVGATPLLRATRNGSTECVDMLLKAGADVNGQSEKCETPLHKAARRKSTKLVNALLKAGAGVNVLNDEGDSPLHTSAGLGSTVCVAMLLKAGANVNIQNNTGDTPFHRAIVKHISTLTLHMLRKFEDFDTEDTPLQVTECVHELLRAGADVNVENNRGHTPLHTAILWRSTRSVDVLLKVGAVVNVHNEAGDTPLHLAAEWGSTECIDMLLKAGANVNVKNYTGGTAMHRATGHGSTKCVDVLLKAGADINVQNSTGDTPLLQATGQGFTECVDVLLNAGADINVQNSTGDTPLLQATRQGSTECVDVLLKAGADINVQSSTGDTPFLEATRQGSAECVDVLLKAGANVNLQNITGDTPLLQATGLGSTESVDVLLKAGADANVQNNAGDTPLLQATGLGSTECVGVLLKAGADINVQNSAGDTPLLQATRQGSTNCIDVLLKAGANVNVQNSTGDTPLLQATAQGSAEYVDVLLKAGADINVQGSTGDTPLLQATGQGFTNCVDVLLKAGAKVNVQNRKGDTSLHKAADQGSAECVDALLKAGADANVQNDTGDTPLHVAETVMFESKACVNLLLKAGAHVNVQNDTGDTPLHNAAGWGSTESVDVLLKAGADVNVQNNTGDTPLHAATSAVLGGEETICVLLKAGADVNVQNNTCDTPLHRAAGLESTECVAVLLKGGANVNVQNNTGDTPLHIAAGRGSTECVAVLLKGGANVNVQNNTGDTPLHTAAVSTSPDGLLEIQNIAFHTPLPTTDCVDVLLRAGAGVNIHNKTGDTPLHKAAEFGSSECVDVLLKAGADVNVQNETGDTPLHIASVWLSTKNLHMLLVAGAIVNVQNNTGDTPLHTAAGRGCTECVAVLLKAGADVNELNNKGDTPLHRAAEWGSTESVDVLLKAGADVKVQNSKGRTPLD